MVWSEGGQGEVRRKGPDNNTNTTRTASKWSSDQPSTATVVQKCAPCEHDTSHAHCILIARHFTSIPMFICGMVPGIRVRLVLHTLAAMHSTRREKNYRRHLSRLLSSPRLHREYPRHRTVPGSTLQCCGILVCCLHLNQTQNGTIGLLPELGSGGTWLEGAGTRAKWSN